MKKLLTVISLVLLTLLLASCEVVDSQMLEQLRLYFPLAEITHPRPDILTVRTHLANLTEKLAQQLMATLLRENCCHASASGLRGMVRSIGQKDLDSILPLAGYNRLIVEFEGVGCFWEPGNSAIFYCRTQPYPQNELHSYLIQDQTDVFVPPAAVFHAPQLRPFQRK